MGLESTISLYTLEKREIERERGSGRSELVKKKQNEIIFKAIFCRRIMNVERLRLKGFNQVVDVMIRNK